VSRSTNVPAQFAGSSIGRPSSIHDGAESRRGRTARVLDRLRSQESGGRSSGLNPWRSRGRRTDRARGRGDERRLRVVPDHRSKEGRGDPSLVFVAGHRQDVRYLGYGDAVGECPVRATSPRRRCRRVSRDTSVGTRPGSRTATRGTPRRGPRGTCGDIAVIDRRESRVRDPRWDATSTSVRRGSRPGDDGPRGPAAGPSGGRVAPPHRQTGPRGAVRGPECGRT